jgi:hypothetical protein
MEQHASPFSEFSGVKDNTEDAPEISLITKIQGIQPAQGPQESAHLLSVRGD